MCLFSFHGCKNKIIQLAVKIKSCFQNISLSHASRNMGHNQRIKCEKLCFCPSKRNGIHGKLDKIEFGCKYCRICHLGRLSAIIMDALYELNFNDASNL